MTHLMMSVLLSTADADVSSWSESAPSSKKKKDKDKGERGFISAGYIVAWLYLCLTYTCMLVN